MKDCFIDYILAFLKHSVTKVICNLSCVLYGIIDKYIGHRKINLWSCYLENHPISESLYFFPFIISQNSSVWILEAAIALWILILEVSYIYLYWLSNDDGVYGLYIVVCPSKPSRTTRYFSNIWTTRNLPNIWTTISFWTHDNCKALECCFMWKEM